VLCEPPYVFGDLRLKLVSPIMVPKPKSYILYALMRPPQGDIIRLKRETAPKEGQKRRQRKS